MSVHATWKGSLNLSLVSVAVKAYAATTAEGNAARLNQLHVDCHRRIQYQKLCPQHGTVSGDQIVMGFPCGKDQYVVIDPEELDQLRSAEEKRAIRIDTFVGHQQLSPLYASDRHYYLLPDGATAEASYRVLQRAMAERGVQAIGQVVLSKREQLVLVRPLEALLCMTVLKYAAQVRLPETFADQLPPPAEIGGQELELAQTLIDSRSSRELDYGRYQDAYAQKLAQLVEAKVQGKALVAPPADEPRMIVNLLEALQASVAEASGRANAKAASKALAGQLSRKAKAAGKRGSKRSAVRKTRKKKTA